MRWIPYEKTIKDVIFAILIVIVITILEFIVTIPFGEPVEQFDRETWSKLINRELLLTALPAALTTFIFSWLIKTKSKSDVARRGIIWTGVLALYYIIIGLGNNNFELIFSKEGIYVLLVCVFAGPVIYGKIKHIY